MAPALLVSLTVIGLFATQLVAQSQITLSPPSNLTCGLPATFEWQGGSSPYEVDVYYANNVLEVLSPATNATSFEWVVDGTGVVMLGINDAMGNIALTDNITIALGSGANCFAMTTTYAETSLKSYTPPATSISIISGGTSTRTPSPTSAPGSTPSSAGALNTSVVSTAMPAATSIKSAGENMCGKSLSPFVLSCICLVALL